MHTAYARAIQALLKKGTSEAQLVTALFKHLKDTGRVKLLPGIVHALREQQQKNAFENPLLEIAKKDDTAEALREAESMGMSNPRVVINPDLISGWRARKGSVLIDQSAKRSLIDLYRRITS